MSNAAVISPSVFPADHIGAAQRILRLESSAIASLADRIDGAFADLVQAILRCDGSVIVMGMGKAGLVGQKIAATLASTGTRSHYVHPAEAIHGDLGRIHREDVALILSFSGETEEIVRVLPVLKSMQVPIAAITARNSSTLGKSANYTLQLGNLEEACYLGLAPSTSTTAMLALGDALALVTSHARGFQAEDFARYHPGGSLGVRLKRVEDQMRPVESCRLASDNLTIREALVTQRMPGRRSGALLLVDGSGKLSGIFTDSDLSRILESRRDEALDQPIHDVMTGNPRFVTAGTRLSDAVQIMVEAKLSELPVVDGEHRPLGLIDVTDLIEIFPREFADTTDTRHEVSTENQAVTLPLPNHRTGRART